MKTPFEFLFNEMMDEALQIAQSKGFMIGEINDGEQHSLIHTEVSESFEEIRHGNPPSDHIPEFSGAEEELADVVIRCANYAKKRGWNLSGAIVAKMAFNKSRPYKHGGKTI